MNNIKVKEITVSLSGVIPQGPYENLRPGYSMTVEPINGESPEKVIEDCQRYLRTVFDNESRRGKAELLKMQFDNIRWYDIGDLSYPSVTSILFWDAKWHVDTGHLTQLASRGTIVGEITERFLQTGEWVNPENVPSLTKDVSILKHGSSELHWDQCSHRAFCEKFGKDVVVELTQGGVYNEAHFYAGTYDILGTLSGKKTLMDIKCGATTDMRQLAAYAVCVEGVEQLAILPLGPTDNKCGYKKPIVCTDIEKEFGEFLKARAKFRKEFGV